MAVGVSPSSGNGSASLITNDSNIPGANVDDALNALGNGKFVWDYYASQGDLDSVGSDLPISVPAPAAADAIKNFMDTRELVAGTHTGFHVQFDVPASVTKCLIRIWSRGTGTGGPWVPVLQCASAPDAAAITAFSTEEIMTALVMAADTTGAYDQQSKTLAELGALVAGERGFMQVGRDSGGQAGDTLATSVFIYHLQLIFS